MKPKGSSPLKFNPKNQEQREYVKAIQRSEICFATGPAGCGKTFVAVAVGLQLLIEGKVDKIVITRPAVEAGEKLGYLPGDQREKMLPFLQPIFDALNTFIGPKDVKSRLNSGEIEIAPLAYLRGRTFTNSFIILDEAQNTTDKQMFMFLTRMGFGSKIIVAGDEDQSDLRRENGLVDALFRLEHIGSISFIKLFETCRHPVVQEIVDAYLHTMRDPAN